MKKFARQFGRTMLTATMLLIPATIMALPAKATTDDDFLTQLHAHGLASKGGDSDLIALGHKICGARIGGMTEQQIITALAASARNGVTVDDVTFIVKTSEQFYCPNGATV